MITAQDIVADLLEDYATPGDWAERPGGSRDMWRQGGYKKFSFRGKDFTGKRPGEPVKPAKPDDEDEERIEPKPKSRFQWKPPKEA